MRKGAQIIPVDLKLLSVIKGHPMSAPMSGKATIAEKAFPKRCLLQRVLHLGTPSYDGFPFLEPPNLGSSPLWLTIFRNTLLQALYRY